MVVLRKVIIFDYEETFARYKITAVNSSLTL